MLDIFDFVVDKGGNPEQIKESQRKRHAPVEAVDEVIALYEDHRRSKPKSFNFSCGGNQLTFPAAQYAATQVNTRINEIQKQIGAKKKVCSWKISC